MVSKGPIDDAGIKIIAAVLGGRLPDDDHEEMLSQFWAIFPQFEHMRGVIDSVVAERRATAARHKSKVQDISARWGPKREAVWDELFETLLDGNDGSQEFQDACGRRIKDAGARAREIGYDELAEIQAAVDEDVADLKRCLHFLLWHHEREAMRAMRPKVRCV